MSTSATAITLTLGAVLGAGWVKTFSDGAASMNVLSAAGENIDETLTRIGARKTPLFDNLADSEEKLERARRELERYQAKLNDKTPTESQTREAARLTAAVDAAQRARQGQAQARRMEKQTARSQRRRRKGDVAAELAEKTFRSFRRARRSLQKTVRSLRRLQKRVLLCFRIRRRADVGDGEQRGAGERLGEKFHHAFNLIFNPMKFKKEKTLETGVPADAFERFLRAG